ncbi:hypothetical protein QQS21_011693 [Conoideocrella luteorostrata]|uniref:Uncharacterized protein n=1 Tax=Conoideocrella luteorostrata TaxID=1105319 RepID=A0AAJ0CDP7_9HYPO|nr:hypothetical protein QQS21_011693 [Conoideocrella luteorostrata]
MEDIYRNLSTLDCWGRGWGTERSYQATELWQNDKTGVVSVKSKKIDPVNVNGWVAEETAGSDDDAQTLILRLVWLDVDVRDKVIRQSEETTKFVVNAFGLKLAYGYARSCLAGATELPLQTHGQDADLRSYCVCYTPKVAAVWSQRQQRKDKTGNGRPLTQAIFFVQEDEKKSLQMILEGKWSPDVYRNAIFPALPVAFLLGAQIDETVGAIKNDLRAVERRTGYHNFASRHESPAKEELGELSAKTSGTSAKLASTLRKSKTLEKLLSFMQRVLGEAAAKYQERLRDLSPEEPASDDSPEGDIRGCSLLKNHVSVLQERQEMQVMDTDYTLKRVQVQIDALFSIIQQQDAMHNLELSKSTHEIAYFSYRDSASMKTLAVVTMFFLPGSFVSALFSTQCFEWAGVDLRSASIGVKPTPQFRLYWAITIPLTLMTFLLYFLWLGFQKWNRDRLFHSGDDRKNMKLERSLTPKSMEEAEGRILARRRRETMLEKSSSAAAGHTW